MSALPDEIVVLSLLGKFANSFDLKQWDELKACFTESVYTDYSALRGTPPETLSAARFVELRRQALDPLKTHHLVANPELSLQANQGQARISMLIFRVDETGSGFNTHCIYELGLTKSSGAWKINSIAQKVLWSDGDSQIHQGVTKK